MAAAQFAKTISLISIPIQGCILLTYLNVISSKFIQKFAQKCQYFTLIDQSVPPDNCYVTCLLREKSALLIGLINELGKLLGANFLWAFRQRRKNKLKLKIVLKLMGKLGKRNKFEAKSANQLHGFYLATAYISLLRMDI